MSEQLVNSPVYLSADELFNFSIFKKEAVHFKNVNMMSAEDVIFALRSAGIQKQERDNRMRAFFKAGYVQDWKLAK